jgi:hypothetical protein
MSVNPITAALDFDFKVEGGDKKTIRSPVCEIGV